MAESVSPWQPRQVLNLIPGISSPCLFLRENEAKATFYSALWQTTNSLLVLSSTRHFASLRKISVEKVWRSFNSG
jgi:hypothetical protein